MSRRRYKSFHLICILRSLLKSCLLFLQCFETFPSFFHGFFSVSILPSLTHLLNYFACVEWFSCCVLYLVVCFLFLAVIHKRHCFSFTFQHKLILYVDTAFFMFVISKPLKILTQSLNCKKQGFISVKKAKDIQISFSKYRKIEGIEQKIF